LVQLRLYNISDSAVLGLGVNTYGASGGVVNPSVAGRFTLASTKTIELQYRATTTGGGTSAQGLATSWGTEVYAHLELWKE